MAKKEKVKFIFKWIGIGSAIAVGIVGLICAYLGITGGFKKKVVEPTAISFSTEHSGYQEDSATDNPIFVIDGDDFLSIAPTPLDSTELDAVLQIKSGAELVGDILVLGENEQGKLDYISAEKVENKTNSYIIKMAENFKIVLSENASNISKRVIELYVEHDLLSCKAKVFVDAPVLSYKLKYEKINATTGSENNFFPGDSLYVTVDTSSVSPSAAFSQSTLSTLTNKFKYMTFEIDKEYSDIAEIVSISNDENNIPRAKINILQDGKFAITTYICNTYLNEQKIISDAEYNALTVEERRAYDEMLYGGEDDSGNAIVGFMIKDTLSLVSQSIEIDSITAKTDTLTLDLFSTTRFNADDLEIEINPLKIAGTHYTADDLKYLLNDVEIVGGYFVTNKNNADLTITLANGTEKYIKIFNTQDVSYLFVKKEVDASGNALWTVTINDYYSNIEPSNCLLVSLKYEIISYDDQGNVVTEEQTIYTFVPVTILKNDIPNYKIKLDNNESNISLTYDKKLTEQTNTYSLDSAKLVLVDSTDSVITPESTLQNSSSPYKTTLFVTKVNEEYTISNDVFEIYNTLLGAKSNYIVPKSAGTDYIYAIVVKTNKDGQIVDSNNKVIENIDEILSKCVVLHTSSSITVNSYQELELANSDIISLYVQEQGTFRKLSEDDVDYKIQYQNNEIVSFQLYIRSKVYIKLNVNDQTAFKNAYDSDKITFEAESSILTLDSLELVTIDGEDVYVLPITAQDAISENSETDLIVRKDGEVQYSLHIATLDYTLVGFEVTSNSVDSSTGVVTLSLSGTSSQSFWTVDTGLSQDKPLEVTIAKNPSQATIIGQVDYNIYVLKDSSFDLSTITELTSEIIDEHFVKSSDIMEIMSGYPQVDSKQNEFLRFNIKKAGEVILIVSYTRLEDSKVIYSQPFVITAKYPYFSEQAFNYGNNYEELGGEKYRQITSSYENQQTNLLNFIGKETSGNGENVEGKKIGLDWKYSNDQDVVTTALHAGLYAFEIDSISDSQNIKKEDFSFVQTQTNGQVFNYLVSPKVDTKTYIKIKVSTPFGYEFANTYNYVLIPDYTVEGSDETIELSQSKSSVTLFKIKFNEQDGKFENDGGIMFVTNNTSITNYVSGNENKITGFECNTITIIYLPYDYDTSEFETINGMTTSENESGDIITYTFNGKTFEIRKTLHLAQQDQLSILSIDKGTISIKNSTVASDVTIPVTIFSIIDDKTETISTINVVYKVS